MADLDMLYSAWAASRTDASLNALMTAVRSQCGRLIQDDDAAQDAAIAVLQGLDAFKPVDPTSFSRWVRVISSHRRLRLIPSDRQKSMEAFDENTVSPDSSHDFKDLSMLTPFQREVASRL